MHFYKTASGKYLVLINKLLKTFASPLERTVALYEIIKGLKCVYLLVTLS
jgi:hypothetical protein